MMKNIKLESLKDLTYYKKLALQRYNIPPSRLKYLVNDNTLLEELDERFVDNLIKYHAQPEMFDASELESIQLSTILEYLRKTHILYIYKRLPEIAQSIHILHKGYAESDALLTTLDIFFKNYTRHLIGHIDEEEVTLFRYVEELIEAAQGHEQAGDFVLKPDVLMKFTEAHSDTEIELLDMRKLLRSFLPNIENQSPYRILMSRLQNFELDLHIHSLIEEQVLMPRALELERIVAGAHGE